MELQISGTPIETKEFTWDMGLNMAGNRGTLDGLPDGLDVMYLTDVQYANMQAASFNGGKFMAIAGYKWNRDDKGNVILDADAQKRIAMNFSVEIWNDMRRYDFDPKIFFGWNIPVLHDITAAALKGIPAGKQFRRWRQCSHEFNYNADNLQAIGNEVPGADMSLTQWNQADDAWTINVWWDSDQQ